MADADVTVIGQGSKVTGRITGDGDLEILGHVDGEVEVTGEVSVGEEGRVGSNVVARRIVVRGAVRGDLTASESLSLEAGARVVGDMRAPRIAIAPGALIRGNVQTGEAGAPAPRATKARAEQARPAAAPRAAAPAARPAPAPPAPAKRAPEPVRPAAKAAVPARAKAAPAPVVPVLKKGAKGALKKRAGG